jgi:hypothetical protein
MMAPVASTTVTTGGKTQQARRPRSNQGTRMIPSSRKYQRSSPTNRRHKRAFGFVSCGRYRKLLDRESTPAAVRTSTVAELDGEHA